MNELRNLLISLYNNQKPDTYIQSYRLVYEGINELRNRLKNLTEYNVQEMFIQCIANII